tara:strand:- start:50207 stop:51583 length:1377 start_codon:yes stop_codon:yes gene_type:complete
MSRRSLFVVYNTNMTRTLKSYIGAIAAPALLLLCFFVLFKMMSVLDVDLRPILTFIIATSPIWLPMALAYIAFEQWMWSVEEKYRYRMGRVTLRIKLPQEVFKSPEAMESVLTQMHQVNSRDNVMQTYLDGKHPLVNSLELVSIGGDVRFYANVPRSKVKDALETQLYAQYPGIEVVEEEVDYTGEVVWDPDKWEMISFHMGKKKDEVYPIKTYVDFGLDKMPKEEEKYDPMSAMIEYLGKAKPHERVWIQILMTPHTAMGFKEGKLWPFASPVKDWSEAAMAEVDKLMKRDQNIGAIEDSDNRPLLTAGERDTIAAIERNYGKYAFYTAIRAIYIVETGKFDPNMIAPMLRTFGQYDIVGRNAIGVRWRTDFNYKFFSDISGNRLTAMKKEELEMYKARYYLAAEKISRADEEKIFSVEELATIYHIPGSSILTPGLGRVENTRKEAPSNLPTGEMN